MTSHAPSGGANPARLPGRAPAANHQQEGFTLLSAFLIGFGGAIGIVALAFLLTLIDNPSLRPRRRRYR